jgi:hypothetical protein
LKIVQPAGIGMQTAIRRNEQDSRVRKHLIERDRQASQYFAAAVNAQADRYPVSNDGGVRRPCAEKDRVGAYDELLRRREGTHQTRGWVVADSDARRVFDQELGDSPRTRAIQHLGPNKCIRVRRASRYARKADRQLIAKQAAYPQPVARHDVLLKHGPASDQHRVCVGQLAQERRDRARAEAPGWGSPAGQPDVERSYHSRDTRVFRNRGSERVGYCLVPEIHDMALRR